MAEYVPPEIDIRQKKDTLYGAHIQKHMIGKAKREAFTDTFAKQHMDAPGSNKYHTAIDWTKYPNFRVNTFNKFTRVTIASDILKRGTKPELCTPGPAKYDSHGEWLKINAKIPGFYKNLEKRMAWQIGPDNEAKGYKNTQPPDKYAVENVNLVSFFFFLYFC